MNRKRFCDKCGIEEGWLERCYRDNNDGTREIWYTCVNCGKEFSKKEFKKLKLQ